MPYADPEKQKAAARRYYEANSIAVKKRSAASKLVRRPSDKEMARSRARAAKWYESNVNRVRSRSRLPKPTRPEPQLCECCGKPPGKRRMHLDHCHLTDTFRGWLCGKCNKGIGALDDTIAGVEKALRYLRRAYRIE